MPNPFFVSIDAQNNFFFALRVIFSISMASHCVSLVFLTKFTPPKQATWRNYMMFVQICLISIDIYMDILFVMVPLFPAPCGFSTGPLCHLGVPLQIQTGIGFLLLAYLNASILLCVFHRHQSILVAGNPFKLGKRSNRLLHVFLIAVFSFPPIYFSVGLQEQTVTDEMVRMDFRNLTWIKTRGCYICLKKTLYQQIFVIKIIVFNILATTALIFMFLHMNYVLNDNNIKNSQTTRNIKKSVTRLFIQLFTPLLLLVVPAFIIFISLAADGLISFEQSLSLFTAILCHPIVHNILLISLTPSYRKRILKSLGHFGLFKCCRVQNLPKSSVIPYDATSQFVKIS